MALGHPLEEPLKIYPVSDLVNSPGTDDARCIEPVRIDRDFFERQWGGRRMSYQNLEPTPFQHLFQGKFQSMEVKMVRFGGQTLLAFEFLPSHRKPGNLWPF